MVKNTDELYIENVKLTHPDKQLFSSDGTTKGEIASYYQTVFPYMKKYLINRPLSLVRCPHGTTGKCFYQKHPSESFPEFIEQIEIKEKQGSAEYIQIDALEDIIYLVQLSTLEFHIWGCTYDDLEKPDQIIFDLDPGEGVKWGKVKEAAQKLKELLESYNLKTFIKTSGGKGLHIVIPIKRQYSWDEIKHFSLTIAQNLEAEVEYCTTNMNKDKRKGKIFVDYLRNQRGSTSICNFSVRARKPPAIAMPIDWKALEDLASADFYTIHNYKEFIRLYKDWDSFESSKQNLPKLT